LPHRTLPDIVGTLWLDDRTFELRFVEFNYSRVHLSADSSEIGGAVHFARLPSGAWIIRKWFIRLPVIARPAAPVATDGTSAPWVLVRPTMLRFREEGGEVAAEELLERAALGVIRGVVRDSANRPMPDVTVRVAGTRLAGRTSANGAFSIDSVPFARHTLVAEAAGYDSLGLAAADAEVEFTPGSDQRPTLRAHNARQLYARLCVNRVAYTGYGALRVLVRSAGGDSLVAGLPVSVSWPPAEGNNPALANWRFLELQTDDYGQVTVCEVPASRDVTVTVSRPGGGSETPVVLRLASRGVRGVVVRLSASP
jgi:hypothetical protein